MPQNGEAKDALIGAEDFRSFAALSAACGMGEMSIGEMCAAPLAASMSRVDPVHAATTFGALLLTPALQSNCLRLEALVHLALALGIGTQKASDMFVAASFVSIGEGACGWMEDPSEDVMVGTVRSLRGNFRVLEGIWEGNAFYLQRFLDVLEQMPSASGYDALRSSVYALLRLSDLVCEKADLSRHQLGGEIPLRDVDRNLVRQLPRLRACSRFSSRELASAGIDIRDLNPFIFRPADRAQLNEQHLGDSVLVRRPLILHQTAIVLALPTAVSAAIRYFLIEQMSVAGMRGALTRGLSGAYSAHFAQMPFLGGPIGAPIQFERGSPPVASVMLQVDAGRFQPVVFFSDDLDGFDTTGLAGMNPATDAISNVVKEAVRQAFTSASSEPDYVGGMTLVVSCGIGRGVCFEIAEPPGPGWRIEFMSDYDLDTLSWLEGFTPLQLWRTLELQERAESLGLSVTNINGLINLIGWARSLDGDLVPHGDLPDDAIEGDRPIIMMIDQASQRTLRHEVAVGHDPRVAPYPGIGMLRIHRAAASLFDDDKAAPLYVTDMVTGGGPPKSAYLAHNRTWWAELDVRAGTPGALAYEKWSGVAMWLSRAAPILDALPGLPDGPVVWRVVFEADLEAGPRDSGRMTFEQARAAIRVVVDHAAKVVITRASTVFEDAVFHPENIAERALMAALISGVTDLASIRDDDPLHLELLLALLPNTQVRHGHAFRANGYRERVRDGLRERVVTITKEDGALAKLGFGWKARARAKGSLVAGKEECRSFLSKLVTEAENALSDNLRTFERYSTLKLLLRNMEEAAADRDRWTRTSAAVLALHSDREATLRTMARHDSKLNAVFRASRILVEIAICECLIGKGRKLGEMDLSALMAQAGQLFEIGGWSDAIWWGVMEPSVRITPLGDVHANLGFIEAIVTPHARVTSDRRFSQAADDYVDSFEEIEPAGVTNSLSPAFSDAWTEEFGATFDETRLFLDIVDYLGTEQRDILAEVSEDGIAAVTLGGRSLPLQSASNLVRSLTLAARPSWHYTPAGFADRDLHPWRYRRRLSLLRRPLLQPDLASAALLVAPGMLRESFAYMLGNFMHGDFPDEQLKPKMRAYTARVMGARGAVFSNEVAQALKDEGWRVETELKLTKFLRQGFDRDYGDMDVLAWQPAGGRLLIIECKDVQFRKTYGEIAEQLADFRGVIRSNGRPDYLRRHLDRVDLYQKP